MAGTFDIHADEDLGKHLFDISQKLGDLTPLMADIATYLESSTIERFETETDPKGKRWTKSIRAKVQGGKTLTDSGVGRQSIASDSNATQARVGTGLGYMIAHQLGITIRPKKAKALRFQIPGGGFVMVAKVTLPKREFIGLATEDREEILALTQDFVAAAAASAGGDTQGGATT
jgi:phage virion morphogenesis protein